MPIPVWAIPAATIATSAGLQFSGRKKKSQEDPLAPIRQQLLTLSQGVPSMVARQKELLGSRFSKLKEEGIRDIGENIYAERDLGRTSIYDRLRAELVDKLSKSQAEAELQAEFGGLETQSKLLGQAGSLISPTQPEEPSFLSKLLGTGASLIGQEYGLRRLEDILGRTTPTTNKGSSGYFSNIQNTLLEELALRPSILGLPT